MSTSHCCTARVLDKTFVMALVYKQSCVVTKCTVMCSFKIHTTATIHHVHCIRRDNRVCILQLISQLLVQYCSTMCHIIFYSHNYFFLLCVHCRDEVLQHWSSDRYWCCHCYPRLCLWRHSHCLRDSGPVSWNFGFMRGCREVHVPSLSRHNIIVNSCEC